MQVLKYVWSILWLNNKRLTIHACVCRRVFSEEACRGLRGAEGRVRGEGEAAAVGRSAERRYASWHHVVPLQTQRSQTQRRHRPPGQPERGSLRNLVQAS